MSTPSTTVEPRVDFPASPVPSGPAACLGHVELAENSGVFHRCKRRAKQPVDSGACGVGWKSGHWCDESGCRPMMIIEYIHRTFDMISVILDHLRMDDGDDKIGSRSAKQGRFKRKMRESNFDSEFQYGNISSSESSTDDDPDSIMEPLQQATAVDAALIGTQIPVRWPELASVKWYAVPSVDLKCIGKDSIDPFIDHFGELPKKNTLLADIPTLPDPKWFCKTCHEQRPPDKSSRSGMKSSSSRCSIRNSTVT